MTFKHLLISPDPIPTTTNEILASNNCSSNARQFQTTTNKCRHFEQKLAIHWAGLSHTSPATKTKIQCSMCLLGYQNHSTGAGSLPHQPSRPGRGAPGDRSTPATNVIALLTGQAPNTHVTPVPIARLPDKLQTAVFGLGCKKFRENFLVISPLI